MHVLVFANGEMDGGIQAIVDADDFDWVVCADGGTRHVRALGLVPDLVIGDLDSLSAEDRRDLELAEVQFVNYPASKDETDLELALLHVAERGADRITVLGARGGRIDHELANFLLLVHPSLREVDVSIRSANQRITLVRRRACFQGKSGDLLSLLPVGGDAKGVKTDGLVYSLAGETLSMGPARGISNVFNSSCACVSLESGLLLAIHTRLDDDRTGSGG